MNWQSAYLCRNSRNQTTNHWVDTRGCCFPRGQIQGDIGPHRLHWSGWGKCFGQSNRFLEASGQGSAQLSFIKVKWKSKVSLCLGSIHYPPLLGDKSRVTSDPTHFFGLRGQFIDTAHLPTEFPLAFEFLSAYCIWKNPCISFPLGTYSHLKFKNKLNIIWYALNIFLFWYICGYNIF